MMEKLPRQVYTSEFRRQAVELVIGEGLGIAEASRRLSLSPKTLTNWVRRAKGGGAAEVADAAPRREVTEAEAELSRLRRENAVEACMCIRAVKVGRAGRAPQDAPDLWRVAPPA